MENDWTESMNGNDDDKRTITRKAKTCDSITNSILILHAMSVITYCTGTLIGCWMVDITNKTAIPVIDVPYLDKVLPYEMYSQSTYRSFLLFEYIHMLVSNLGNGLANVILLTMVSRSRATRPFQGGFLVYAL